MLNGRDILNGLGIKTDALALMLGVSEGTVRAWKHGIQSIPPEKFMELVDISDSMASLRARMSAKKSLS